MKVELLYKRYKYDEREEIVERTQEFEALPPRLHEKGRNQWFYSCIISCKILYTKVRLGSITTKNIISFLPHNDENFVILQLEKEETMNALSIIDKYYPEDNSLKNILLTHSRSVADKALSIAQKHPELNIDTTFLEEAALVHDIGIFLCDADGICCHGEHPYISHGYLGAELMRREGYPLHALVCERHTGAGISLKQIEEQQLPIPHRNMIPLSIEEQVICFADKFFSKTRLEREKTVEEALRSVSKFGEEGAIRFKKWCECFL